MLQHTMEKIELAENAVLSQRAMLTGLCAAFQYRWFSTLLCLEAALFCRIQLTVRFCLEFPAMTIRTTVIAYALGCIAAVWTPRTTVHELIWGGDKCSISWLWFQLWNVIAWSLSTTPWYFLRCPWLWKYDLQDRTNDPSISLALALLLRHIATSRLLRSNLLGDTSISFRSMTCL